MPALRTIATGLLPVLAGGLFTLGLSPFDLWPAVPLSMALLAWEWQRRPERAGWSGLLYGAGFFGAGASWVYVSIHVYGRAAPPLAVLLTAIFCLGLALLFALQGLAYRRWIASPKYGLLLGFPALWVLFEWLRSWLLTGFPWLFAGYAALDMPLSSIAPLTGVYGLSLCFAVFAAALVYSLTNSKNRLALIPVGSVVACLSISALALNQVSWTSPMGQPVSVALYQPNIPLEEKWDRRNFRRIIQQYEASIAALDDTPELIIWPESAVPAYRHQIEAWLEGIAEQLNASQTGLITGIPVRTGGARYNSIIGLATAGGEYHKQKLVPFGEYVPLEDWLRGLIEFFDLPMSQFSSGPASQLPLTLGDLNIAPFICYEVVYPDFVASGSRDAGLLVTVSNDSWFGQSIGPIQHLQMARFRALETGRDMLRGTNNGVTALINQHGKIVSALPQFEVGMLTGQVTPRKGNTPYMLAGSYPTLALAVLGLVIARRRRH